MARKWQGMNDLTERLNEGLSPRSGQTFEELGE